MDEYSAESMCTYIDDLFTWARENKVYFYGYSEDCDEGFGMDEDNPFAKIIEQLIEEDIDVDDEEAVNEFLKRNGLM